ncbi:unannotated protein [freshwater metagenome]|uniref:Unannotated protein n=1 Tax=freshwater metagenome TaxID=449393 RepID=A0A6J6UAU8_9ZZZZ
MDVIANSSRAPTTTVFVMGSIFNTKRGEPSAVGTVSPKPLRWPIVYVYAPLCSPILVPLWSTMGPTSLPKRSRNHPALSPDGTKQMS